MIFSRFHCNKIYLNCKSFFQIRALSRNCKKMYFMVKKRFYDNISVKN